MSISKNFVTHLITKSIFWKKFWNIIIQSSYVRHPTTQYNYIWINYAYHYCN